MRNGNWTLKPLRRRGSCCSAKDTQCNETPQHKDQLEPGHREKGNTVFGSHPPLPSTMPRSSTVPAVQMRMLPTATHVLAFSTHAAVSTLLPATTQHSCHTQSYCFQHIAPTPSVSPILPCHAASLPPQDEETPATQGSHLPAQCELIYRQPQGHLNKQCMGKHCSAQCSAARTSNRAWPPQ